MRIIPFLFLVTGAAAASSCAAVVVGAGGEAAYVAAQERSMGNAVDDAGILLKIKNAYAQKDFKDLLANVEIKVTEGRVLLTGNVDKPESQVEGVRLAWQVEGVREVMNEIQLNDKAGFSNYVRDAWVSNNIRARFLAEKNLRSINYSVMTVNQVVYLMGIAQDQTELDRADFKAMLGLGDRLATAQVSALLKRGLLESDSPYGKVRLGVPQHALRFYFPRLWPEAEA